MAAADYLLCHDRSRKVYYRNEAGHPGDELPDGAVLLCGDCAPKRLLEPGSEAREEWGVRYPNFHPEPVQMFDEAMARRSQSLDPARVILSRTVHTGPWKATS